MAEIDSNYKFLKIKEIAENVAEQALDDFLYDGKSIREWMQIIASEDCISRHVAIDSINKIHPVDTEYDCTLLDKVDVRCVLTDLPPVTPQYTDAEIQKMQEMEQAEIQKAYELGKAEQQKMGRWVLTQRGKFIDINCSECGSTRIKEYACGYSIDEIDLDKVNDLIAKLRMNYCECCGAKMQEVKNEQKGK